MQLSLDAVLLSRRVHEPQVLPFFCFWVVNYLPPEVYATACGAFPRDDEFPGQRKGGKRTLHSRENASEFATLCRNHPVWQSVVDVFSSAAFLRDARRTVLGGLFRSRGIRGLRSWQTGPSAPVCSRRD